MNNNNNQDNSLENLKFEDYPSLEDFLNDLESEIDGEMDNGIEIVDVDNYYSYAEDNSNQVVESKNAKSFESQENIILNEKLKSLIDEKHELLEVLKRRQNDFDNFKNRTEKEKKDTFRKVLCDLASQLLPIIDNLNRALDSASNKSFEENAEFTQFVDGIRLINQHLNETLFAMGIEPIISVGQPFNPALHEAVAIEKTDKFPHNTVISELIRGYRVGDRLIRPSVVKVSEFN